MSTGHRLYLFEEDGSIKRVPHRVTNGLTFGLDALPQYANTRQKVAFVMVENARGKPTRISLAEGYYWDFDAEGKIDLALRNAAAEVFDFVNERRIKRGETVVDIRPELKKNKWRRENRWTLSREDLDRIAADIWPGQAGANNVSLIKGRAPKAPALTYEAKTTLKEISSKLSGIEYDLNRLSEQALKGLAFEADRLSRADQESSLLWIGVSQEAERLREIKSRRRTGRGVFYAVLHVWQSDGPYESREIETIEIRCENMKTAIEAGRKLLAENAHKFTEQIDLEVEVKSELEWQPENHGSV